MEFNIASRRVA